MALTKETVIEKVVITQAGKVLLTEFVNLMEDGVFLAHISVADREVELTEYASKEEAIVIQNVLSRTLPVEGEVVEEI